MSAQLSPALKIHEPGTGVPPRDFTNPTVAQIIDWHRDDMSRKVNSETSERERRRNWNMFRNQYGDMLVSACRPYLLKDWINSQGGATSDWTRKRLNGAIQRPFNHAEKMGMIVKNPFRGLTFPGGERGRDWTQEEYQALLRAAKPLFRRVLILIRFSGMRPGEVRELTWANIRREDDKIVIEKHKTRYITKKPRAIPLNHVLGKLLSWLKRNNPPAAKNIVLNSFGNPWKMKAFTTNLAKLREKIGLDDSVKLHGGRHTFATHALMNGVQVASLMELLGHRLLATTQLYTHMENKTDHLSESMATAVTAKRRAPAPRPKAPEILPPFDGLE